MAHKDGRKDNRGGKRPGAGRKPAEKFTITDQQVREMIAAAKRIAKQTGVTLDDILVRIAYSEKSKTNEKLAAIKLFKDYTMVKTSENNVNVSKQIGPVIGLPELKPLPENVVSINRDNSQ